MLTSSEKAKITRLLSENKSTVEISKLLKRDHRTIKKFVLDGKLERKPHKGGRPRKLTKRDERKIKRALSQNPHSSSNHIFKDAGVANIPKTTRNRTLKTMGKQRSPTVCPPLSEVNRRKRLEWAEQHMKTNFQLVLWTDESRATLDGPDGWKRGWLINGGTPRLRFMRQQGGGGVMFWAGIIGETLVGPFLVPDGLKMNSANYCQFLNDNLLPWLNSQNDTLRNDIIFQQDNAPSHASRYTKAWLEVRGFTGSKLMKWPPQSPDINPIENLWSILKRRIYENGRQFSSKNELWSSIVYESSRVTAQEIRKLTSSVDKRLVEVLKRDGKNINY